MSPGGVAPFTVIKAFARLASPPFPTHRIAPAAVTHDSSMVFLQFFTELMLHVVLRLEALFTEIEVRTHIALHAFPDEWTGTAAVTANSRVHFVQLRLELVGRVRLGGVVAS